MQWDHGLLQIEFPDLLTEKLPVEIRGAFTYNGIKMRPGVCPTAIFFYSGITLIVLTSKLESVNETVFPSAESSFSIFSSISQE